MGKWYKSKIFKSITTGVLTTGILVLSAGTATPVVISSASVIGTSAGIGVYNGDQPKVDIGVKVTEDGTHITG